MLKLKLSAYLELLAKAYDDNGNLPGQRDALKTTTGQRIRARMVNDIVAGAVLPPVVVGVVLKQDDFVAFKNASSKDPKQLFSSDALAQLSIIDGMQRTTALLEASKAEASLLETEIRVEFWVTSSSRALVYRMLVLNTGQVPWTIARQLEVVYKPLLVEAKEKVSGLERIMTSEKPGRRVNAGEFAGDKIIELYMAYTLRKPIVDTKEQLSDEFSRLDFVENVGDVGFQDTFFNALENLAQIDKAFSKFSPKTDDRFSRGRHIFDAQPASIGFVVAEGQAVMGRPGGLSRTIGEKLKASETIAESARAFAVRVEGMDEDGVGEFLKLDVLREVMNKRVGQVGRYERSVFLEAFQVLIKENFDVPNMEQCWRAY